MSLDKLFLKLKGGTGSGNFGHRGRPGKRGGSSSSSGGGFVGEWNVFHGTSSEAIESIKKEGLLPGKKGGGDDWAKKEGWGLTSVKIKGRDKSVFITNKEDLAKTYASRASQVTNSKPVLLKVKIPSKFAKNLKIDEIDQKGLRYEGPILPSWIEVVE